VSSSVDSVTNLAAPRLVPRSIEARAGDEDLLVTRAQAGDRAAMQEIYRRHVDSVHRRLTHLLGAEPEREDLLQLVFSELFRGLHRFRGDARLGTYLYRIVTNVACDHLKRRRRQGRFCSCDDLDQRPGTGPSPEAAMMQREQLAQAWSYLDRIKPKKRVAFLLRVMEGLSLEEIADQVGARPSTIAKRIMHAQRELLAMLRHAERRSR